MKVVTVRDFRDRASEMFRSDDVILVTRDGALAGFYLPWDNPEVPVEVRREVFLRLSEQIGAQPVEQGASEEEVLDDFAASRRRRRRQRRSLGAHRRPRTTRHRHTAHATLRGGRGRRARDRPPHPTPCHAALLFVALQVIPIEWKPAADYDDRRQDAEQRIAARDPDDWPTVALALTLGLPVRSQPHSPLNCNMPRPITDTSTSAPASRRQRITSLLGRRPADKLPKYTMLLGD